MKQRKGHELYITPKYMLIYILYIFPNNNLTENPKLLALIMKPNPKEIKRVNPMTSPTLEGEISHLAHNHPWGYIQREIPKVKTMQQNPPLKLDLGQRNIHYCYPNLMTTSFIPSSIQNLIIWASVKDLRIGQKYGPQYNNAPRPSKQELEWRVHLQNRGLQRNVHRSLFKTGEVNTSLNNHLHKQSNLEAISHNGVKIQRQQKKHVETESDSTNMLFGATISRINGNASRKNPKRPIHTQMG